MSKRRFSKEDWIALGLEELSAHGAEAVKLERICTAAQLTRGSFYHHFDDHEAFIIGLAEHWLTSQTTDVAGGIDDNATGSDQAAALTDAVVQIDYRLELGMRELARRFPAIAKIVKQADDMRVEFLGGIYETRFDLDATHARDLAFIEYAAFSGVILIDPDIAEDRQKYLAEAYERLITRALGT